MGTAGDAEQIMALAEEEMVGHAGDVVADYSMARLVRREFGMLRGHAVGMVEVKGEKRVERGYGAVAILDDGGL